MPAPVAVAPRHAAPVEEAAPPRLPVSGGEEPGPPVAAPPASGSAPEWRREPEPDLDSPVARGDGEGEGLQGELDRLRAQIQAARAELIEVDDALVLQQMGVYEYHHPLENADAYRERLDEVRAAIKEAVRQGRAIEAAEKFTFNNSPAQGRKFVKDFGALMLRAYNSEAESCVRTLRSGALAPAVGRLEKAAEHIARLGALMQMHVAADYHRLRVTELELVADYRQRQAEEREIAREERERLREEAKVAAELAAEKAKLDKQREHYLNALAALGDTGASDDVAELEALLAGVDAALAQNDYRTTNIRAGYVYVISNRGTMGPGVVKIGLTRRLEPMDRVRELGDASVPFPFDVHALFFSDDAVTLENELHRHFADRRLNQVNLRREFFFATPAEVREVVAGKVGSLLEFVEEPVAEQYQQSLHFWPAGRKVSPAN
ncbi:DUF4041 domain-containing protein [Sanguibacter massiliensis]|uniref:DUF4041 domain-containing protein n=1 Tax=Sanguibacter massiliensis TaxID=1973217 RepID=UPI001F5DD63B|nr:DUF4041 domain-containing protein [Sanguibacter massiliensis]